MVNVDDKRADPGKTWRCNVIKTIKFDEETVIADFLGDLFDGHPRVGHLNSCSYKRLRELAQVLIADLKDNAAVTLHERKP